MIRKFEFDTIYVIESLGKEEIQTGSVLYEDLLKRLTYRIPYFKCDIKKINSKVDFFAEIEKIKT